MGPKAKKKELEPEDNGVTRPMVVASYTKMCRAIGVPMNSHVSDMIKGKGEEADEKLTQLLCMAKSGLQTLSLQGNVLGDPGLLNLSKGLKRSQSLVRLNISDNGIRKAEGARIKVFEVDASLPPEVFKKLNRSEKVDSKKKKGGKKGGKKKK
ncbi:hypothetical protein DYB30_006345 [Aphanomyces astaci]|uniref:Uncharacterized protein n=1 Tax=Aphanomyces astaci TaxID=112090 RepID=A0A397CH37_APHAT|nr:hypothetical protein DYB30_006345 [Aphanomyces astaci]RHY55218.1 hypothetical protein DYB34_002214 [Aphanomyces astaci]RHY83907.1 hypothetical protein DYB26_003450 [Aphanomyces astaci]